MRSYPVKVNYIGLADILMLYLQGFLLNYFRNKKFPDCMNIKELWTSVIYTQTNKQSQLQIQTFLIHTKN